MNYSNDHVTAIITTMPRPRPTTDQHQHIIRCDDALWDQIVKASTKSTADSINAYVNRILAWVMTDPHPELIGTREIERATMERAAKRLATATPTAYKVVTDHLAKFAPAPQPFRPFSKEQQTARSPKGSGRPPKAKA